MSSRKDQYIAKRALDGCRILALYAQHHSWLQLAGRLWKAAVRPMYARTVRVVVHSCGVDAGRDQWSDDVVELTRDDIDQLLGVMYVGRKDLLARFDRGERCFAVLENNRVISFFWSQVNLKDWEEMDLRLDLQRDRSWMYNSITVKQARGRGLYPKIIRHMFETLRRTGVNHFFVDVQPHNRASIRGLEKAGFTRIAIVSMRKILSKTTYHVAVFDRSRWDQLASLIVNYDRAKWMVIETPNQDGCPNPQYE